MRALRPRKGSKRANAQLSVADAAVFDGEFHSVVDERGNGSV